MHPIDALAPVAMFAVIGTAVLFYGEDAVRAYLARRRRLNNPLLKMAEDDCRRRHRMEND